MLPDMSSGRSPLHEQGLQEGRRADGTARYVPPSAPRVAPLTREEYRAAAYAVREYAVELIQRSHTDDVIFECDALLALANRIDAQECDDD